MLKKSLVISVHVGFWLCYLLIIAIMLGLYYRTINHTSDVEARVVNAFNSIFLFAVVPSFISYWVYYLVLFPAFLQKRKIVLTIVYGGLTSIVAAIIGYVLLRYFIETGRMIDMDEGGIHGRTTAVRTIITMTLIGAICGCVAMVINGFINWYRELKLKEALTEKNHAMEMALVRSQLDPHLLFNTINNIDMLILKDPESASTYLNKLSEILRFVLYETKGDKIPLAHEIAYIEKYIALQKIRTSNENYVHFEVTGQTAGRTIAPMVFIPFIENAFKHTNNKKLANAISIKIEVNADRIHMSCINKFDSKIVSPPNRNGGLGQELAQKRLDLIYGGKHLLHIQQDDDLYTVQLTIPE